MDLEQVIEELKKVIQFKENTEPGDLVLVLFENPQIAHYGRISSIERDFSKRDEWWHVTFHLLTIPPQKVVWTLRTEQFTGREIFTMGGEKRFMQAVRLGDPELSPERKSEEKKSAQRKSGLRVVK